MLYTRVAVHTILDDEGYHSVHKTHSMWHALRQLARRGASPRSELVVGGAGMIDRLFRAVRGVALWGERWLSCIHRRPELFGSGCP